MLAYVSTVISTENSEQLKRLPTIFEFLKKLFDEEGQSTEIETLLDEWCAQR